MEAKELENPTTQLERLEGVAGITPAQEAGLQATRALAHLALGDVVAAARLAGSVPVPDPPHDAALAFVAPDGAVLVHGRSPARLASLMAARPRGTSFPPENVRDGGRRYVERTRLSTRPESVRRGRSARCLFRTMLPSRPQHRVSPQCTPRRQPSADFLFPLRPSPLQGST